MAPLIFPDCLLNRGGKDKENPFIIDSSIYKESQIVQYAMKKMKELIKCDYSEGQLTNYKDFNSTFLDPTNRNSNTEGNILSNGGLIVEQNNLRLKYVDNRFILNAKSEVLANGTIKTTWFILCKYDFELYPNPNYSIFKLNENTALMIDDGLSKYLVELGIAEEFYYAAKWEEIWSAKKYQQ